MKFTLSWLKEHLETAAGVAEVVEAMTMAGLEVERVADPAARLAAFTVARVVEAAQHPNADRLRVCRVETIDGVKEIVCGAPNAWAGLFTIYAPIGTFIPGSGIILEPRAVRGVVSNGMLCSAAELEIAEESDGILELGEFPVGTPAAEALSLEAVIDFEVTPNRPDWLGVHGIARDLAAAGLGRLIDSAPAPTPGAFPCPVDIRLPAPEACPAFAGRLIRGVKNGPSPAWLQARLGAIGLRPISALVDITNLVTHDRARPLHVYDAAKIAGGFLEARLGREGEGVAALDGRTYAVSPRMCVIADGSGAIGLGGVIGGTSTGCSEATTEVFIESAWFDPLMTAQTGRDTGILSDAQYRFARGVDPLSLVPGVELATRLILDLCGGEASEVAFAGEAPAPRPPIAFDPAYVERLSGLAVAPERVWNILADLGFTQAGGAVQAPSWRRDVDGKADLVEEVARIVGYGALPAEPLPPAPRAVGGVLTQRQSRIRAARRALAAAGYQEALTWSFVARRVAVLFGGGDARLVLENPIAADLDTMRPSGLPGLIEAVGRNQKRGFADCALFEIGPAFSGDEPADQRTAITAVLAPHAPRRWDGGAAEDVFALKADLIALLDELGAPGASLHTDQTGTSPWWRPGRSARLRLGPKVVLAEFGEIHPSILAAMDVEGPVHAFEIWLESVPEARRKGAKTRPAPRLSPFMPLTRDFAFVVDAGIAAGDLVRAVRGADRALIGEARVFDAYVGPGVPEGAKSLALEITIQPRQATLTEGQIEALCAAVVAAAAKSVGARLRT
ncbi:MAG TPA: phenylalanine--tRNA ligase subunit beta [Caulobacteraceae bacterium]|nr:phenylalanine--tRNA ligase subunit beta [Caulobacteraceae bacterium]